MRRVGLHDSMGGYDGRTGRQPPFPHLSGVNPAKTAAADRPHLRDRITLQEKALRAALPIRPCRHELPSAGNPPASSSQSGPCARRYLPRHSFASWLCGSLSTHRRNIFIIASMGTQQESSRARSHTARTWVASCHLAEGRSTWSKRESSAAPWGKVATNAPKMSIRLSPCEADGVAFWPLRTVPYARGAGSRARLPDGLRRVAGWRRPSGRGGTGVRWR